jgi:hypothetical protein
VPRKAPTLTRPDPLCRLALGLLAPVGKGIPLKTLVWLRSIGERVPPSQNHRQLWGRLCLPRAF